MIKDFLKKYIYIYQNDIELKKIVTNINWLFLDQAIQMSIAFFVGIMVIRYLGPEKYGVLSYAVAIASFFIVLSKLGLDAIVVREFVDGKIKKEKLLGTVFYLKFFGGIAAVIFSVVVTIFLQDDYRMTMAVAVVSMSLIFQSADVVDFWFQSQVKSKYTAYARSFAGIVSAVVKIYFISISAPLAWFIIIIALESVLVALGLIVAYLRNKEGIGRWVFDSAVAKNILKDSWPLILVTFSAMIYMRIDQIMIGGMLGYETLGSYSVAVNLSEMWYFIPVIINASVFPAIIYTKKRSKKLYYKRLQKLYNLMALLALGIAILVTFFGEEIINVLYGAQYEQGGDILAIYIWGGIFIFLGSTRNKWMIAENLQKYMFYFAGFAAIINIILNMYFIRLYGINGAAWTTLISYAIAVFLAPLLFKKTRLCTYMMFKSLNIFRVFSFFKK